MCTQLCNWTSTVSLWGVGYGVLVSDPKSWIEALHKFILLRSICHSFVTTGPQTGGFLLSPPREANRGKSIKLEVDVDKHTRGSILTPRKWQLVCLLTTFPKRNVSMFPKKATSPLQGWSWQHLCGWVSSRHCGEKGSSVTLDDVPVPPAIRSAWGTNSHSGQSQAASLSPEPTRSSSPRQKAGRPWKPANRVLEITRATFLELFRQSRATKRFLKGFSPG